MKAPEIETALRIYTNNTEIGTSEIMELFECGASAACKLKRLAKMAMAEKRVKCFLPNNVNVEIAFKTWGIDVDLYRRKYKEQKRLQLRKEVS